MRVLKSTAVLPFQTVALVLGELGKVGVASGRKDADSEYWWHRVLQKAFSGVGGMSWESRHLLKLSNIEFHSHGNRHSNRMTNNKTCQSH